MIFLPETKCKIKKSPCTFNCALSPSHRLSRWTHRESKPWANSGKRPDRRFHRDPWKEQESWPSSSIADHVFKIKTGPFDQMIKQLIKQSYSSICQVIIPVPIWSTEPSPVPLFVPPPAISRQSPASSSYLGVMNLFVKTCLLNAIYHNHAKDRLEEA